MKRVMKIVAMATLIAFTGSSMAAGTAKWTWEAGKQSSNGAITVKAVNNSTSYTGTQNPTGAVAKTNQIAVTQPPTVIVQATSSLPVRAVGDVCTASTSGTAPNQTADEGIAITLDRTAVLSCQGGTYKTAGASSNVNYGGAYVALYANASSFWCGSANPFTGVCSCPAGYTTILAAVFPFNNSNNGTVYTYGDYECYKLNYL